MKVFHAARQDIEIMVHRAGIVPHPVFDTQIAAMVAGFGDGAPGYIPTDQCWRDGYEDDYCWVPPMTGTVIRRAT